MMKTIVSVLILVFTLQGINAQTSAKKISEKEAIKKVLLDYMEGTAEGQPDRIKNAFHSDLNLYSIQNNDLRVLKGQQYISYFKEGQKRNRIGKIISIDFVNDAGIAKVEIDVPNKKRLYTDYMMLLKVKGKWKIIHKSYTSQSY